MLDALPSTHAEKLLKYLKAPVSLYLGVSSKSNHRSNYLDAVPTPSPKPCLSSHMSLLPCLQPSHTKMSKSSTNQVREDQDLSHVGSWSTDTVRPSPSLRTQPPQPGRLKVDTNNPVNQDPSISPSSRLPSPKSAAKASCRTKTKAKPAIKGGSDHMSENMKRWLQEDNSKDPWTGQ